ncbi:MAG: pilus assembly protein PilM, partial [Patescibacteria group bacterium]
MNTEGKFFLDFFPPPAYLTMPALCFDLSDRSMKYMEFYRKRNSISVKRSGLYKIPEGIIEKGEIKQKNKLIDFLKTIKDKLRSRYIIASLPEEKVFVSKIQIPMMKKEYIRESIELQLDQYVPLSAKEAVFDFDIIREDYKDKHIDINLIVFPRTFVEEYKSVFIGAGFVPLVFEMEAQAFTRAVVPESETGSIMAIDFGRTRATFAIVSRRKIQFTTTVAVAGGEIDKAIMDNLRVSLEEADKIKKEVGFIKSKDNERLFNAILPIVSVIKDEAAKQIIYWNSHQEEKEEESMKISKIMLCGGESTLAGFS